MYGWPRISRCGCSRCRGYASPGMTALTVWYEYGGGVSTDAAARARMLGDWRAMLEVLRAAYPHDRTVRLAYEYYFNDRRKSRLVRGLVGRLIVPQNCRLQKSPARLAAAHQRRRRQTAHRVRICRKGDCRRMMQLLQKSEDAVLRLAAEASMTALLRTVAAAAALCMLLAHGFAFTNLFPNHDSTVLVFDAQWTMYVLGRWAQNLYFPLVRGKIAAPWLIGAFSIVYLALTGYIIAKLLHLRRWSAALLTGLLGTCASVTAQLATYTYETDAYLLAMLLACAAVWCSRRLPRLWGYAGAAVCLCGCLALYQSYIQFAVGLYLLLLLQSALQGAEWRPWLRQGVGALLTLALGAVLYVVSLKVSLALTGYQLADTGNGLAQMFRLGPAAVLAGIPATYGNFFKTLLGYSGWNDRGMRAATALLFVLAAAGLVLRLRGRGGRTAAQVLLAAALLPLGLNVSCLLASGNVYILMQHALFLVYLVPMVLFGGSVLFPAERRTGGALVGLLCAFLILRSIICANGAYVYTKLVYDNTARQMTQIMADVGKLDGYKPGTTPVAFAGTFTDSNLTYHDPAFSRYEEGSLHQVNVSVTYDGTIKWWFQHVMGSSAAVLADQATLDAVGKKAAVQAMPNYPAQGYCAMVDGTAVIKLSD